LAIAGLASTPAPQAVAVEVFFSPKGGCEDAIIREIGAAKDFVHVQAYSFTSAPIAKALLEAHKRGVKIEVIIDKSRLTENYNQAVFLANQGFAVFVDAQHHKAHNKVMVIDRKTVITGSYNFTKAAEEFNAENLVVIQSAEVVAKYEKNYQDHLAHSPKYERKE
jgi:phosphatidylserine/phosphatidylglycerophosphate/cardiolipin synthase-like enzyme